MSLVALLARIDEPNRERCLALWADHTDRFNAAQGSSHNHQAWPGGYLDHVRETMDVAIILHPAMSERRPLPFSVSDALLVLFLHDVEKPWKAEMGFESKADRRVFRESLLQKYGIELTPAQANALRYVEGEGDDYRSDHRVMGPLAAFCHCCDVTSARIWPEDGRETP